MMKKNMRRIFGLTALFLATIGFGGAGKGYALPLPYAVNIDTSSLFGTVANIAFDLVSFDGLSNSVSITNFATDGALGSSSTLGGVSGSLPGDVTLSDIVVQKSFVFWHVYCYNRISI